MSLNGKESGSFDMTANEMLRRLNNQYKADKFADKYITNEEYIRAEDGSVQIDISSLSDEDFKMLFDSYLIASKMNVSDMTDSTYKSLQYHIANLQQKSGATLVTEDEMERRFADADAARAALALDRDEDASSETANLHFPEIPNPGEKIIFDSEEDGAPVKTTGDDENVEQGNGTAEFIQPVSAVTDVSDAEAENADGGQSAEDKLKKRRMSIFSHLKSLVRFEEHARTAEAQQENEAENENESAIESAGNAASEAAIDTAADASSETENANANEAVNENVNTNAEADLPEFDEDDIEGATEEFVSPFTAEREAVAAMEMQATEVFDSVYIESDDDISPDEEMLENRVEDSSEIPAYSPDVNADVTELAEDDENEAGAEADAYGTPHEEFIPEEPRVIQNSENENSADDAEIVDAFVADPIEDYEDVPKHIFEETSYETEENDYPPETAEQDAMEEADGYVSFDQNPEVLQEYKRKYTSVRVRMGISAALALILLVFENIRIFEVFGLVLPEFMKNAAFTVPFEWAMIFAAGFLVCDALWGAMKKLVKFEFEPATVTLVAFVLSAAATLSALFVQAEPKFYNFPFVLIVFFNLLSSYISVRKEIFSFKIISAAKKKHAVTLMNAHESAQETEEFAEYLSENSQCYRIDEADFVGGYFAKKKHAPKMCKKLRITLPIAIAAAIAAAALSAVFGEADVYRCLVNASVTFMMCAPAAVFFANELPMYLSSLNAYSNNSAILGDSAPEMMENMATVSFTDKDVFQNDGVRIKGVKVIGNNRIDHIIYYATSVFDIVGGPLAKVFKHASLENSEPESAEVRVISDKGIDAMVDGKHIVMGVHQFMDAQCFNPVREAGDEQWEGKTNKRILYLACNEELIAKFYVEYNVNPEFVFLVKKLAKAGVCIGVRTNDPCVDIDIFYRNKLSPEQYPLRVVKGADMPTDNGVVSAKKTSLVAAGSLKGLIKTILVCDRLRGVLGTNFVIKTVAAVVGLLIMGFIVLAGVPLGSMWSLYFALYQLIWLAPVYVISKIYI